MPAAASSSARPRTAKRPLWPISSWAAAPTAATASSSEDGGTVYTRPFDESKVEDPSLIIYAAVRRMGGHLIVTNGDQTDTICEGLARGQSFEKALESRCFEPDAPNFTPRISGMVTFVGRDFRYEMSILKSADAAGSACSRYHFCYPALPGVGHFLHTYVGDGNPLPTFQGEPERMAIPRTSTS